MSAIEKPTFLGTIRTTDGRVIMKGAFPILDPLFNKKYGVIMVLSDITAQHLNERNAIILILEVGIAILILISFLTAKIVRSLITKPIIELTDHANRVSMGDNLSVAMMTTRTDEIGELIRSFERMRMSIKHFLSR
ncbi:MAG: HAMP domain-containing protein [Thermodesulfovibrionales bacterium]|nr:HAMP domain-containing protein [Thermodesulfovibrionales bacterium]